MSNPSRCWRWTAPARLGHPGALPELVDAGPAGHGRPLHPTWSGWPRTPSAGPMWTGYAAGRRRQVHPASPDPPGRRGDRRCGRSGRAGRGGGGAGARLLAGTRRHHGRRRAAAAPGHGVEGVRHRPRPAGRRRAAGPGHGCAGPDPGAGPAGRYGTCCPACWSIWSTAGRGRGLRGPTWTGPHAVTLAEYQRLALWKTGARWAARTGLGALLGGAPADVWRP